ncbi:MAG: hypothetical protein P4L35_18505 [Ignavibacteriaceae bacterium]|nr:hypothetical protein [Ignavibacteriaceae bacterium]
MFIQAESQEEALLVFISVIFCLDEQLRNKMLHCCLIIEDIDSWNQTLTLNNKEIIVIPYFKKNEQVRLPQGRMSIVPVSRHDLKSNNRSPLIVDIPKQNKTAFSKALEDIGIGISDVYEYIAKTKRSFLALYRQITIIPSKQKPGWVNTYDMRELIPALLAGGWNENKAGDIENLSEFANRTYDEYIEKISHWLVLEDSPITKTNNNYQIVSTQDMWNYLYEHIVKSDYEKFHMYLLAVFGAKDPKYELPEKDWYAASVYGKEPNYSKLLCESLIVSLVMLSLRDGLPNNFNVISTENEVDFLVKQIMDNINDWDNWYTIAPFLPLLAEASPKSIIQKFEEHLRNEDSCFWLMFAKPSDPLFGTNYYTNVLWALEKLAWHKEFAFRSIVILTRISERNFEFKIVNSPFNSLYEIFCLWHPQSALSIDERMRALKYLMGKYQNTAWKLLGSLLPSGINSICGNIQTPIWRDWDENIKRGASNEEYLGQVKIIIDLLLDNIIPEEKKWVIILDNISAFIYNIDAITEKLLEQNELFPENDRQKISDKIRSLISKHRHFVNADWSMKKESTDKLEIAFNVIEPKDVRIKHKHLFSFSPALLNPYVYEGHEKYDWNEEKKLINDAKEKVMQEIFAEYGLGVVLDVISNAEESFYTGVIFAEKILNFNIDWDAFDSLKNKGKKGIVSSTLCRILQERGLSYIIGSINANISSFTDKNLGDIFCMLPFSYEIWAELEKYSNDISDTYWSNVDVFSIASLPEEQASYAINKLLLNKRPYSIMKNLTHSKFNNTSLIIEILDRGMQLVSENENNGLSLRNFSADEIVEIFKKIYDNKNIDDERVSRLELFYLPYFKYFGKPLCLFKEISNNPELYVFLISLAFKGYEVDHLEVSEEMQVKAKNAYEILNMFKSIPGFADNYIDSKHFNNWINKVLIQSKSNGRGDIAESLIGELLSHSPVGEDGVWPHEIIREYFEMHCTQRMADNFIIGKTNQRGVHTINGGKEEKEIAQKYKEQSEEIQFSYPQSAILLKRLNECYLGDARRYGILEEMDFRYF